MDTLSSQKKELSIHCYLIKFFVSVLLGTSIKITSAQKINSSESCVFFILIHTFKNSPSFHSFTHPRILFIWKTFQVFSSSDTVFPLLLSKHVWKTFLFYMISRDHQQTWLPVILEETEALQAKILKAI